MGESLRKLENKVEALFRTTKMDVCAQSGLTRTEAERRKTYFLARGYNVLAGEGTDMQKGIYY